MPEHVRLAVGACRVPVAEPDTAGLVRRAGRGLGLASAGPLLHRDDGSPYVAGGDPQVSVSHDAGCVAVAAHARDVGVDLQHVRSVSRRFSECLRRHSGAAVGRWSTDEAIRSWVAREAIAKAMRRGLQARPWTFPLDGTRAGRLGAWDWATFYRSDHRAWLGVAVRAPDEGGDDDDPTGRGVRAAPALDVRWVAPGR